MRTGTNRPWGRPLTCRAALVGLLLVVSGCSTPAGTGPAVTYDDVDIDTVTAPAADADGARDFLGSGTGPAQGDPLLIGWINEDQGWDVSFRAAAEMLNRELDGISGRPIEIVACGDDEDTATCSDRIGSAEPLLVIIGDTRTPHTRIREGIAGIPALGVEPDDPGSWTDELTRYFTLGVPGTLRAAATWAAPRGYTGVLVLVTNEESLTRTLSDFDEAAIPTSTLVLTDESARDAENRIAEQLDRIADGAPDQRLLVVNTLDGDGCVSLARAVDVRVANPSWGQVDVVTTGNCASKTVHKALGDWPPGWYHVGAGPDLELYAIDPQVRVYRDRITRYGGEDADWSGANTLPFTTLVNAARMLAPLLEDGRSPAPYDVVTTLGTYTGPGFMGMPAHECGADPKRPSLCTHQARVFVYNGKRGWANIVGDPFDILR